MKRSNAPSDSYLFIDSIIDIIEVTVERMDLKSNTQSGLVWTQTTLDLLPSVMIQSSYILVIFPGTRCATRNRVFITCRYTGYPFEHQKQIYINFFGHWQEI